MRNAVRSRLVRVLSSDYRHTNPSWACTRCAIRHGSFTVISALSAQQHFRRTEKGLQLRQKPQAATRVAADSVATNSSVASAVYTIVTPAALTTDRKSTRLNSSH